MKLEISGTDEELQGLLNCIHIGQLCPDERFLLVGNPVWQELIAAIQTSYIDQVGEDAYRSTFTRDISNPREIDLLAGQLEAILRGKKWPRERAEAILERIARPCVLPASARERILARLDEFLSE